MQRCNFNNSLRIDISNQNKEIFMVIKQEILKVVQRFRRKVVSTLFHENTY